MSFWWPTWSSSSSSSPGRELSWSSLSVWWGGSTWSTWCRTVWCSPPCRAPGTHSIFISTYLQHIYSISTVYLYLPGRTWGSRMSGSWGGSGRRSSAGSRCANTCPPPGYWRVNTTHDCKVCPLSLHEIKWRSGSDHASQHLHFSVSYIAKSFGFCLKQTWTTERHSIVINVMGHANKNGEKCCFVGNVLYH